MNGWMGGGWIVIEPNIYTFIPLLIHLHNLTLGAHAQRGLQYLVCVSVTQHLTFHAIICGTNDTNLLSGG